MDCSILSDFDFKDYSKDINNCKATEKFTKVHKIPLDKIQNCNDHINLDEQ